MSGLERLLRRFIFDQDKITLGDVERLLVDHFGYKLKKKPGSENVFHKKGANPFTVPTIKGRHIKKIYVQRMVKILELEEHLEKLQGE
jgi:hypothetical protein